jgi:hypothetical protein
MATVKFKDATLTLLGTEVKAGPRRRRILRFRKAPI